MADQDDAGARSSWRSGSAPAPRRAPASPCLARTRPGSVHMVWIESMTTRRGAGALRTGSREYPRRWSRRRVRPAHRRGRAARRAAAPAPPLLRPRYRRRDGPARRQRGAGLDQQGRFADAGIAAEQDHRPWHEPAARDPVEFGDPRADPWSFRMRPRKAFKRENAAFPDACDRPCGDPGGGAFLDEGIPFAAILATSLPALRGRAAILADKLRMHLGHAALRYQ